MKLTTEQVQLIEINYKLIFKAVFKYLGRSHFSYDEIYDICVWSIIRTATKYEPERGFTFSTLYFKVVENKVRNVYRDQQAGKRQHNGMLSINKSIQNDDGKKLSLSDMIGDSDKYLFEDRDMLNGSNLTSNENEACFLYYFKGLDQREIAGIMGCTQAHVSRLIRQGIKKIKEKSLEEIR